MTNPLSILSKIPDNVWKILVAILLVILIALSIETCTKSHETHKLQNDLATATYNSKMAFDSVRAKDGSIKATQDQLKAFQDDAVIKQIKLEDKLKSVQSQVVIKTVIQIEKVFIPYLDSTKSITKIDSSHGKLDTLDFIQVPARVQTIDSFFQLDATVLKTGLEVNYLLIPNTTTSTIGITKGLFKHSSVVINKESNPHIKIVDMKNIVDDPQQAKKQWTTFGIGVAGVLTLDGIFVAWYLATHH